MYLTGSYTLRELAQMAGVAQQTIWCWVKENTTSKRTSRYIDVKKTTAPQTIDPPDAEIEVHPKSFVSNFWGALHNSPTTPTKSK